MKKSSRGGSYLKRLQDAFYHGQSYVHWTMTIENRKTGWLVPIFYYKFRELLTHTMFRYKICCPIFCLMPDHMHLLWLGVSPDSDQRLAMKFLRGQLNLVLNAFEVQLQDQPYDHVLDHEETQPFALENLVEYIARNPERKQLVRPDGFRLYKYTSCLVPGYPNLDPFQDDFWDRFDSLVSQLRRQWSTNP